jgi:CheY-like chemotaxis protein
MPIRKILVVDDNRDAADSLAAILRVEGHEARAAYSGAEAVQAAEEMKPDVVLLDIQMPEMSGYDVARALRDYRRGVRAVIVAVTAYGQESDKLAARQAGFHHHITKPVDPARVLEIIESVDQ